MLCDGRGCVMRWVGQCCKMGGAVVLYSWEG